MKTQKNVIPLSFLEIILQFTAIKSFVCYLTLCKVIYKLIMSRVLAFILLHMVRLGKELILCEEVLQFLFFFILFLPCILLLSASLWGF